MADNEMRCQQCGANFNSREELDRHNMEKHGQTGGQGQPNQ